MKLFATFIAKQIPTGIGQLPVRLYKSLQHHSDDMLENSKQFAVPKKSLHSLCSVSFMCVHMVCRAGVLDSEPHLLCHPLPVCQPDCSRGSPVHSLPSDHAGSR